LFVVPLRLAPLAAFCLGAKHGHFRCESQICLSANPIGFSRECLFCGDTSRLCRLDPDPICVDCTLLMCVAACSASPRALASSASRRG
jgi:hypothetical protein